MNERRKRLLRSRDDRMLAGVAGGIADYFDLDPTLVRAGFVAAVLFGGLGIAAYLVLAVVTPNDDGSGSPVRGERPSPWLVALTVLAVLLLLPGPLWGPFEWWWSGSLWLALLVGGAVWLYVALRDRDRGSGPPPGARGAARAPGAGGPPSAASAPAPDHGDRDPERSQSHERWRRLLRALAIAVLAVAAASVAISVAAISAWATATGSGTIVAGVVIALGIALAVGAFSGERRLRWLIVPALVLALPAGAVAAGDVDFDRGIGSREYRPSSPAELRGDGYGLGIGQLVIDLRALEWRDERSVELETDMGVGQTVVSVPSRVCVAGEASASMGEVMVRGRRSSGLGPEVIEAPPSQRAPRLVIGAEIDIGQIVVTDRPPEAFTDGRRGFGDHDAVLPGGDERERSRQEEACAR